MNGRRMGVVAAIALAGVALLAVGGSRLGVFGTPPAAQVAAVPAPITPPGTPPGTPPAAPLAAPPPAAPVVAPLAAGASEPARPAPAAFDPPPAILSSTAAAPQIASAPIVSAPASPPPAAPVEPLPEPKPAATAFVPPPPPRPEEPAVAQPVAPPPPVAAIEPPRASLFRDDPRPAPLLTLRGSNTIGSELGPKLAQAFLTRSGDADVSIIRDPKAPEEITIVGRQGDRQDTIAVHAHGTAFAFKGLASDNPTETADIGMASRRVKTDERELLKAKGDVTSADSEHVLGLDGIAVVVHPRNPIATLTTRQLKDVFSGAVTDWGDKAIGGTPGPIRIYARDANSGTFDAFSALVLRGAKLRADAERFEDSAALAGAVEKDPAAIGFIGLPYVGATKALAVAEPGATPVKPNRLTVATEDYPLARRLFLYTTATNDNPLVRRFIEFSLSPAGQAVVDETGFVALTVRSETVTTTAGAPAEYVALVKGAERLTTDFRFKFSASELDNRGVRDTRRLAEYLAARRIAPDRLILIGFGDNIGVPIAIRKVSEERAKAVAKELRLEGINVGQVAGVGALMPVADNDTEEGREKNRRVEVYIRP